MPTIDPRTPVLVGAGQVTHRPADGPVPSTPELLVAAARAALADTGAADQLLARTDAVGVVDVFSWDAPDPGAHVADALGAAPRETLVTVVGGNGPTALLGTLAARIAAGELDVTLLVGGEAMTPFMASVKSGEPTGWPTQPEGTTPAVTVGADRDPAHAGELAAGLIAPVFVYPLFEQALRRASGRSVDEHQEHLGRLWSRFADVAAENPHAWTRDDPDAATIAQAAPANRQVSQPYTKLMNANIQVDQAAALVLCSAEAATAAGIPEEHWVFPASTAGAHDHWFVGEREHLDRSPALAAVGRAALGHAGVAIEDVDHLDLYSCFPSAVQIAARELGVDLDDPGRAPTVTGGLTFAGGPANAYVVHSLATLVHRLRGRTGEHGLATAVGWYLTKHGAAVLASDPPATPFAAVDVQPEVDGLPRRAITQAAIADVELESYTAIHDHTGSATMAIVTALDADGNRGFAKTGDRETIDALLAGEPLAHRVSLDGAAGFTLAG